MFTDGLMKEMCGFSSVIRMRLELTINGLKDQCYDVVNPYIIGFTEISIELRPTSCVPFNQFVLLLALFINDGKSHSNRLKLNFAYFSLVVTEL